MPIAMRTQFFFFFAFFNFVSGVYMCKLIIVDMYIYVENDDDDDDDYDSDDVDKFCHRPPSGVTARSSSLGIGSGRRTRKHKQLTFFLSEDIYFY